MRLPVAFDAVPVTDTFPCALIPVHSNKANMMVKFFFIINKNAHARIILHTFATKLSTPQPPKTMHHTQDITTQRANPQTTPQDLAFHF